MEQVQMEHWEMDIEKINGFNFLNEETGEFTRRWIQNLVNVRSPSYLQKQIIYSAFHSNIVMHFR